MASTSFGSKSTADSAVLEVPVCPGVLRHPNAETYGHGRQRNRRHDERPPGLVAAANRFREVTEYLPEPEHRRSIVSRCRGADICWMRDQSRTGNIVCLMEPFAREDVRQVLRDFGVTSCRRATTTDSTEEVLLVGSDTFNAVDIERLTRALMDVLPHTKVWVVEDSERWDSEPV